MTGVEDLLLGGRGTYEVTVPPDVLAPAGAGVRVVRAFGQQKSEIDKFTKLNETYRVKTYKLFKLLGFYWGLSDSVGYIQIALSLCMGVIGVYRGTFTLGSQIP